MTTLVDCHIFRLPYTELRCRIPNQREEGGFKVLSGSMLLPHSVVLRWEWQKRVCIPRQTRTHGYSNFDARFAKAFHSRSDADTLYYRYLNSFFVRRQRFEALDEQPPPRRTDYEQNLTFRQLPGMFPVWYLWSYAKD